MKRRTFFLFGWIILTTGCGADTGSVSGTVTFKGDKVPSGTISFIVGDRLFQAEITDGSYEISGLTPGKVVVTVVRLDPSQPDPYEKLNQVRTQMAEKKTSDPKEIDPTIVTDTIQLDVLQKKRHLLPLSYSSPETSTLRFTIVPGPNTINIALLEKGRAE